MITLYRFGWFSVCTANTASLIQLIFLWGLSGMFTYFWFIGWLWRFSNWFWRFSPWLLWFWWSWSSFFLKFRWNLDFFIIFWFGDTLFFGFTTFQRRYIFLNHYIPAWSLLLFRRFLVLFWNLLFWLFALFLLFLWYNWFGFILSGAYFFSVVNRYFSSLFWLLFLYLRLSSWLLLHSILFWFLRS